MAVDELLMESVRDGGAPTLRFYRWSPACLSFGRNQPAAGIYSADLLSEMGVGFVRRLTGGRAVLHHHEITYSVAAPAGALGGPRSAYLVINQILRAALSSLAFDVQSQDRTGLPAPIPDSIPCFAHPLPGEILFGGRKLIGSAQVHIQNVLLQHGSILLGRSPLIDPLESRLSVQIEGEAAYLGPGLLPEMLPSAIAATWQEEMGSLTEQPLTPSEEERADALTSRFLSPHWTWRR